VSKIRLRYQTIEFGKFDIHVRTLRDNQQFADDDGRAESFGISSATWPLFGIVWESGEILARHMSLHEVDGLRVLEIGCGIGLASLVLAQRGMDITATDQHPDAKAFLTTNAALNTLEEIPFERVCWDSTDDTLGTFDLIVGSDLLYEQAQVLPLCLFIRRHANPGCQVLIVDPGRGLQGKFTTEMGRQGYTRDENTKVNPATNTEYKGRILRFSQTAD